MLSPQYIDAQHDAWGPAGEEFSVSCLLPIQPLKGGVKLHRCCKVSVLCFTFLVSHLVGILLWLVVSSLLDGARTHM